MAMPTAIIASANRNESQSPATSLPIDEPIAAHGHFNRAHLAAYPDQLSGRQLIIRRADLGAAGIYYRAVIGPFASAEKATKLCSRLKAAGGDCIIQKN
jgi:hypothetical protein